MVFLLNDSSYKMQQELPQAFFVAFYNFCIEGVKWLKMWFCRRSEIFIFNLFGWVFAQMIPFEKFYKVTLVLRIIFYPVISPCPAIYCVQLYTVSSTILGSTHYYVQHIIVSDKILCPHLAKGSSDLLSQFNVQRS